MATITSLNQYKAAYADSTDLTVAAETMADALVALRFRSLSWEDTLEEGMATHSTILAWRIPQKEEPDGLQSMGSQRAGHD